MQVSNFLNNFDGGARSNLFLVQLQGDMRNSANPATKFPEPGRIFSPFIAFLILPMPSGSWIYGLRSSFRKLSKRFKIISFNHRIFSMRFFIRAVY